MTTATAQTAAPTLSHAAQPAPLAGNRDFDFVLGRWKVTSRRLAARLQDAQEWIVEDAEQTGTLLLDGLGNHDEFLVGGRLVGGSLRFYDLVRQEWAIYWVSARDGVLQPPVHGRFRDGTGVFEGDDVLEGRPIRVRYTWTGTRGATPRWEQAFSADGGATWETNWIMEFRRD